MIEVAVKKSFKNSKTFQYKINTSNERIVLFGPSGSGKSSLIKMIAGLIDPDEGVIKVNNSTYFEGKKKKIPVYKRRVGYLPQEYTLFPHMNVEENILYGVKINKIKVDEDRYWQLLEKLELSDKLKLYPAQLSGGEKQRVAFARAILVNPDILLFDEPFSSLDKVIKEKLRDIIIDIIDETGKKAIFVTHDFEDAFILGKEVFIVYNGRIIERGSADKIFNYPEYVETARILNIKNIWKTSDFPFIVDNNFNFIGIKPENVLINSEKYDFKFPAVVKKIKKNRFFYEIIFEYRNIEIFSIQPEINFNKGETVEVSLLKKDLLFFNQYEF